MKIFLPKFKKMGFNFRKSYLKSFVGAQSIVPSPLSFLPIRNFLTTLFRIHQSFLIFDVGAYCNTPLHHLSQNKFNKKRFCFCRHIIPIAFFLLSISSLAFANPEAFVVNNLAETISRIDLTNGNVQNHITTLGDTPNQIVYCGAFLYVVNSISADLQKIDPQTHLVVSDMPLPRGSNPYSVSLDSQYAYVSCLVSGEVARINISTGQIQGQIIIGGYPEGSLIFGNRLYVTQTGFNPSDFSYGQGRVAVIDLANFALLGEINVGKNPQSIFTAPDGRLHIVCTGNYADVTGAIYIYNPTSEAIEDSVLLGGQPVSGIVTSDGIAFLAAGGWVDHGYIYSYNTTSGEILHGASNPIFSGIGVSALALDSLGFIYSCNFGNDTVTRLSSAGQIEAVYNVGDGPQSIVILDSRVNGVEDQDAFNLPESPAILGSYPNPFNAEAIIEYRLPAGIKDASVAIYNIEGKAVRRLNLGTGGDIGKVIWNGHNGDGVSCSSGIYIARLETGLKAPIRDGSSLEIKLILIK